MTQLPSDRIGPLTLRDRLSDWLMKVQFVVAFILVTSLLLIGFLWHRMFIMIPPGYLGIIYRTLHGGTETDRIWGEGLHIIPPWDQMTLYEVRLQQETLQFKVLSDEGLTLGVQVVVRFRPSEEMLGYLQKDVGTDYFNRLIKPEIESHVRRTFGSRPAHELYATVRDVMQELDQFPLIGRFEQGEAESKSKPYVHIQDVKLIIIELPQIVENAIVEKYHQEQLMLAYRYKLEREIREADRKRTEAAGIRDFNHIAGKSADILRWRSLEVASEFAKSPNAKVVVLGGAQGGLPMILNLADGPSGTPAEEPPAPKKLPATGAAVGRPVAAKPTESAGSTSPKPTPAADSSQTPSVVMRAVRALAR